MIRLMPQPLWNWVSMRNRNLIPPKIAFGQEHFINETDLSSNPSEHNNAHGNKFERSEKS